MKMRNHKENGNHQQSSATTTTTATAATTASVSAMAISMATATATMPLDKANGNINNNNINNSNGQTDKLSVSKLLLPAALKSNNSKDATTIAGAASQQTQQQQRRQQQFTPLTTVSDAASNASFSSASVASSIQDDMQSPPTQQQQHHQQQLQQQQSLQHLDQCGLTQAGLEEYNIRSSSYYDQTTFHHQKQASYAQSEGYHSYVSSSDSTSATPFLDKLRQEGDLLSRPSHNWSENDLSSICSNSVAPSPIPLLARQCSSRNSIISNISNANGNSHHAHAQHHHHSSNHSPNNNNSNNNNNNNSSESTSSTETLKWLGSMSDISEASHATGYSAIAESVSSSQLIVHSSRVLTPKRHQSESVLYLHDNETTQSPTKSGSSCAVNKQISEDDVQQLQMQMQPLRVQHRHSPSYPPVHTSMALHRFQQQHPQNYKLTAQSSLPELESPPAHETRSLLGQSQSTGDLQQQQQQPSSSSSSQMHRPAQQHKSSISVTISSSEAVVTIAPQPPPSKPLLSKLELHSCSAPNVAASSADQSPPLSAQSINDSYRSNHRLFPVSTYTEPVHSNTSQYVQHPKPQFSANLPKSAKLPVITPAGAAVQPAWHSVAERINDFERSQVVESPHKFAYLEPSKTHRLSNPALKALQKNAVQSYVERQQQQAHKEEQQLLRSQSHSHSYQALHQADRKSLPNNLSPLLVGIPSSASSSVGSSSSCSSPTPPPPPPRSRSLLPNLLRRSSSASDYADFREQKYQQHTPPQQQQQLPSIRNISSAEKLSFNDCGMPPPPPPPRGRIAMPPRRTSSATEYAPMREKLLLQQAAALAHQQHHPQQHRAVQPLYQQQQQQAPPIQAPPERPPKHPHLRVPSPELPPPPQGIELDTSYTFDEPLPPPPPPEVLQPRAAAAAIAPPSPNRRNSFAGASTRRVAYAVTAPKLAPKVPPQVPKKPTSLRQLPHKPPALSNGAVKPTNNLPTNSRKRPHNPPPILESVVANVAPPPLLPRARPTLADSIIASNLESNQQKRSNSKASYLPRQSLEKLNNTDPDHGIYKLTLTSNEDLVAHSKSPSYAVMPPGKLKLPNNLPDVLPLGVKLQQQPVKPSSSPADNIVAMRYGSNNNLATKSPTNATTPTAGGTAYAMIYGQQQQQQQRYSSPALGHAYGHGKSRSPAPQFTRSQSYDVKHLQLNDANAFMSQSHVDLKQAVHDLETTLEEDLMPATPPTPPPPHLLSPAHSDCSLSNSSLECSPVNNTIQSEAHIFRAELISTTTPATLPKPPPVNRQESLRENIEKITQLQSQLMSAHLCDTGILNNYTTTVKQQQQSSNPSSIEQEQQQQQEQQTSPTPKQESTETQLKETETETKMDDELDDNADSLKLMQRSELVLIVNPTPSTVDMACQTDDLLESEQLVATREEQQTRTTLQPRQRQAIELEYEHMALELLRQLPASDKLIEILTPKSYKPTTQYVNNLYNPDVPLRPFKRDVGTSTLMRMKAASALIATTTELQLSSVELQLTDDTGTNLIKQKLDELIRQLNQKIVALKREQQTIGEECAINDKLGSDLLANLTEKVRPSEASKFRTYIDDVGHITSLLLSLSERLAQTESSLEARASSSQQEKTTLAAKCERLYEQLEEAQRLKADIDRRGSSIAKLFGKHLSADMCADYDYFINMKAKLIADARDLAERIKGSEEQLGALSDALVQSDC